VSGSFEAIPAAAACNRRAAARGARGESRAARTGRRSLVSVVGIAARGEGPNGEASSPFARKWRGNSLKRFNLRPEWR